MKYKIRYCDGQRQVMMKEIVEFDGPAEDLLREICEKAVLRYWRMTQRLSKEIPDVRQRLCTYRVMGREAVLYNE